MNNDRNNPEFEEEPIYSIQFDPSSDVDIVSVISQGLADGFDVDLTEVPVPLYDVINTDSLNNLFKESDSTNRSVIGSLWFRFIEFDIVIKSNGVILIARTCPNTRQHLRQLVITSKKYHTTVDHAEIGLPSPREMDWPSPEEISAIDDKT